MRHRMLALAVPGLFLPSLAFATNGYISHGIGVRSQGTAGVGYALVQDAFAAAAKPNKENAIGASLNTAFM